MVSEYRDFSDRCATNYLFFVVAISNILLTGLPHPQPLDSWPRVLTFELWHGDLWYVQLLFILATLEYLFVLPKWHLLQMWTEFLKIYFLLWPFIDFFLYLPLLISTYIHICTCMC